MQILGLGITNNVDDISTALLCTNNNVDKAIQFIYENQAASFGAAGPAGPKPVIVKPKEFVKTAYGEGEKLDETFTEMTLGFDWGKLILPKGNEKRAGQIRRTKQRFKKEVIQNSPNDIYLFGDNDVDFNRETPEREYSGGMASATGPFDRCRSYGIMTTFYASQKPSVEEYKDILSRQFESVRKFLSHGLDIIVPEPNIADLSDPMYGKNYHKDGKQVITHNLGTGLSGLSQDHLLAIEEFLKNLGEENLSLVEKRLRVEPNGKGEVPEQLKAHFVSNEEDLGKDMNGDKLMEEEEVEAL